MLTLFSIESCGYVESSWAETEAGEQANFPPLLSKTKTYVAPIVAYFLAAR